MKKRLLILLGCVLAFFVMCISLILLSAAGQKNSLPYKPWKNREEMIKVLVDKHYLYPTYLPADKPIDNVKYNSRYIHNDTFLNLFPRDETADNFNSYDISYYADNSEKSSARNSLHAVNITFQRNGKGAWDKFYQTVAELKCDPYMGYDEYIYILADHKEVLGEMPVFLTAYYTHENSSFLNILAYCNGKDMLSRFKFDFYSEYDKGSSDRKYNEKEEEILQYVMAEIDKTLRSMEPPDNN